MQAQDSRADRLDLSQLEPFVQHRLNELAEQVLLSAPLHTLSRTNTHLITYQHTPYHVPTHTLSRTNTHLTRMHSVGATLTRSLTPVSRPGTQTSSHRYLVCAYVCVWKGGLYAYVYGVHIFTYTCELMCGYESIGAWLSELIRFGECVNMVYTHARARANIYSIGCD